MKVGSCKLHISNKRESNGRFNATFGYKHIVWQWHEDLRDMTSFSHNTVKNVAEQDGMPIVERLPNGKFDVLCYGNEDGTCKGCKYHKTRCLNACIAQCQDTHHVHWIHYKPVSSLKGTRIKQANEFDKLITASGNAFIIMPDPVKPFAYVLEPVLL